MVLAMLVYSLNQMNFKEINLKFLLSCPTYMPVDSMHSSIEASMSKPVIWAPSEWATIMQNARHNPKSYYISWMEYDNFLDFKPLVSKVGLSGNKRDINNMTKCTGPKFAKLD